MIAAHSQGRGGNQDSTFKAPLLFGMCHMDDLQKKGVGFQLHGHYFHADILTAPVDNPV